VANEVMQADVPKNVYGTHRVRRKWLDISLSLGVTVIDLRNLSVRHQYNHHHSSKLRMLLCHLARYLS
jgi:hypothetical protein